MRVLIAGGAGFIGSWVVAALQAANHEVIVYDNLVSGRWENIDAVAGPLEQIEADICDLGRLRAIDGPIDAIVHLAYPTPLNSRDLSKQFYETASVGTANLLELALERDAYFLYGSSISVYGRQDHLPISEENPTTPMLIYGANKLLGENLCSAFAQIYGVSYGVVRISDTFGPRDTRASAVNNFLAAARDGKPIQIAGRGTQQRSYSYVADIANAIVRVLDLPLENDVVNITTNEAVSILSLAEIVRIDLAPNIKIVYDYSKTDPRDYVICNEKLTRLVGHIKWTSLREGLALTHAYRV
jgi:UDP-glucose 4-epimerase